jgi:YCII-related domain
MQFLVLNERRSDKFTDEELMPKVPAEFERVREMYSDSFVRQIWHRGDVPGGALIVEGESQDAVEATLATLPLVEAGMVEVASVIPLKPFAGFCP